MKPEIKMIQDAVQREGRIEDGKVVVPADFFGRLDAQLNPPGKGILDIIFEKLDGRQ